MPIITLTTDFGLQDYYVATLKGALLQKSNQLNIIDISHNINHYDIVQAAFVLKNAFNHFPSNTIHLVCVNNYVSAEPSIIVAKHWGHYFVVPDNGLMALLFEELPKEMYRIYLQHDSTSPMRTAYAKIVQYLVEERPLDVLAEHVNHIIQRISLQPVIGTSQIRGTVIYIDHYENAVVNITKDLFYRIRQDRDFALYFKRYDPITTISNYYYDVQVGDVLCLFNTANYLEIAINMGRASGLLGLAVDDAVQIDFS